MKKGKQSILINDNYMDQTFVKNEVVHVEMDEETKRQKEEEEILEKEN